MDLTAIVLFAGALIVTAGSPGPSIAALVARVLARGYRDILPFLAALWLGEVIWLTMAVWGLASLAESFATGFLVLKWTGIAYLLYLAWQMWQAPVQIIDTDMPKASAAGSMFMTGLAITIGNPKIMVFYLALLPTIIDLASLSVSGWLTLTGTMLIVLIAIDLAWVLLATKARLLLKSPTAVRLSNRLGAGMIAGAATLIASK